TNTIPITMRTKGPAKERRLAYSGGVGPGLPSDHLTRRLHLATGRSRWWFSGIGRRRSTRSTTTQNLAETNHNQQQPPGMPEPRDVRVLKQKQKSQRNQHSRPGKILAPIPAPRRHVTNHPCAAREKPP